MSNQSYNRFFQEASSIKEGYECGDILGSQPHIDEMFSDPDKLIILTEEEFIEKCKTNPAFSKRWTLNTQSIKLQSKDYSLISNEWIDGKIKGLQERIENLKKEEQTDENVLLLKLSSIKLRTLEYIKRNVLIPSEELTKDLYSKEDLREAFRQGQENIDYSEMYGLDSKLTEQEWFEQYKKQIK